MEELWHDIGEQKDKYCRKEISHGCGKGVKENIFKIRCFFLEGKVA